MTYVDGFVLPVPKDAFDHYVKVTEVAKNDIIVFSYVTYRSRAERDEIMKKVMEDTRIKDMMEEMPAYMKRMIYGGFEVFTEA